MSRICRAALPLFFVVFMQQTALADFSNKALSVKLNALANSSPKMLKGIAVISDSGQEIFSYHADLPLKPASVQKLLVTGAVLQQHGIEHRFHTRAFADSKAPYVSTLYIKGGGDPDFKIEDAWHIARELYLKGVRKVSTLALDDTYFVAGTKREGQRAYESGAAPLAFNFNSISFLVCPGAAAGSSALIKHEPYELKIATSGSIKTVAKGRGTFAIDEVSGSGGLSYNISGTIGIERECQNFYRSVESPSDYFGNTFLEILKEVGIGAPSKFTKAQVPNSAIELVGHESKAVSLIVRDMNHFSTNFIAEELLYSLAESEPLSRDEALSKLSAYAKKLGLSGEMRIEDASGLSHGNRVSAKVFATLINDLLHDNNVSAEFAAALSVGGVSGTLKKRDLNSKKWVFRGKTGTLDGVSSVAGVVSASSNRAIVVIIFNDVASIDAAMDLQEKIIQEVGDSL